MILDMRSETNTPFLCVCGSEAPLVQSGSGAAISEATCRCGRKYQVDLLGADRVVVSEPITPEPRQPLSGFSRELKANEDSQRFYFSHVVTRGHRLPVHILFSPSARQAEVATGDMKPMRRPRENPPATFR